MPQGDKARYTDKQERKADHIADHYERRGVAKAEAERRAWATVNQADSDGGKDGSSASTWRSATAQAAAAKRRFKKQKES